MYVHLLPIAKAFCQPEPCNCKIDVALCVGIRYLCNMKLFFLVLFLMCGICALAQVMHDTVSTVYYLPGNVNVTVHLLDRNSITGDVWSFTDSSLRMYGRNSAGDMVFKNLNYTEMRSVKIKRYAFAKGMMKGSAVGNYIITNSDAAYKSSSTKEWLDATAVIVASAVIGGALNNATTKKKFKINGNKQKFEKVFLVLLRAQPK